MPSIFFAKIFERVRKNCPRCEIFFGFPARICLSSREKKWEAGEFFATVGVFFPRARSENFATRVKLSAMSDEVVRCVLCGDEWPTESSGVIYCPCCESYYCQTCCWETLPESYKTSHVPELKDDEFDDDVCDWCKWDISPEEVTHANNKTPS
jgi:hypothetical protein